jgi:hypothetical protein
MNPPPLVVLTQELAVAQVGRRYAVTLAAEGGVLPLTWSISGLPPGLSAVGSKIEGTPESDGLADVTVRVSDAAGVSVETNPLTLQVLASQSATTTTRQQPLRVTAKLPLAVAGFPYEVQLAADGGAPPYQWHLLHVIPGLSLSSAGVLKTAAVPESMGSRLFVEVYDQAGVVQTEGLALAMLDPTSRVLKASMAFSAVAGWVILLLLIKAWVTRRDLIRPGMASNVATLLAFLSAGAAFAIFVSHALSTLIFVAATVAMACWLYWSGRHSET